MRTTVISGAGSGIGAAVRRRLMDEGERVIGVDLVNADIPADLSTPEGRTQAIDAVRQRVGGEIDGLVLCAGLGPHLEDLAKIISVNYFGAVELLDGLKDELAGRPNAAALVIASNSAQFMPFEKYAYVDAMLDDDEARARELIAKESGFAAYGGSKHALSRAIRRRSSEFGKAGIRLNAIAPGTTQTPLLQGSIDHPVYGKGVDQLEIPLGHRAEPNDIADVIVFLQSPQARYVHGSIVYADGGTDAVIRPDRF
jgi:NAD(P)-dependent dehydrogenase (short-subunit alcohol dehydrogenase family)